MKAILEVIELFKKEKELRKAAISFLSLFFMITLIFSLAASLRWYLETEYEIAVSDLKHGHYTDALERFEKIAPFKDSNTYISDIEKEIAYQSAYIQFTLGNYENAINGFTELGNYKDSVDRILNSKYNMAIYLYKIGEYHEAFLLFYELKDYKDSPDYLEKSYIYWASAAVEELYKEAIESYNSGNLIKAYYIFVALGDYKDSKDMMNKCGVDL